MYALTYVIVGVYSLQMASSQHQEAKDAAVYVSEGGECGEVVNALALRHIVAVFSG